MAHDLGAEGFSTVRALVGNAERRALQGIPGSHRYGRLDADRIAALKTATPEVLCAAAAGDGSSISNTARIPCRPAWRGTRRPDGGPLDHLEIEWPGTELKSGLDVSTPRPSSAARPPGAAGYSPEAARWF